MKNISVVALMLIWAALGAESAKAADPVEGYIVIQRAFLREDFQTVQLLAPGFIAANHDFEKTNHVYLWFAFSLDKLGRPNEALMELDTLKERLDENDALWPELLFWEGDISRRANQIIRAKLAFGRLYEQFPQTSWASQAHMGLGLIYFSQQAFDSAIEHFHILAIRQSNESISFEARLLEGLCYIQLKQFDEARAVFELLVRQLIETQTIRSPNIQSPEHPVGIDDAMIQQASFYLGESLSSLGRYEESIPAYRRTLSYGDSSRWAYLAQFGMGWAFYQLGRCEESFSAFDHYLAKQPATDTSAQQALSPLGLLKEQGADPSHRLEALFAQGSCLIKLGKETEALKRFEQIIENHPGNVLALESGFVVADAYRREGRLDRAKDTLHTLLRWQLLPDDRSRIQQRLGAIAIDQGNAVLAKTLYSLSRESYNASIRQAALNGLGDVQMFNGNFKQASDLYEEAISVDEHSGLAAISAYQLGRLRLQLGDRNEASNIFKKLTNASDPALADDAKLALVLIYLAEHQQDLARTLLFAVRKEHPNSLASMRSSYYEALMALDNGDEDSAKKLCQEVLSKAPKSDEAIDAQLMLVEFQIQHGNANEAKRLLLQSFNSQGARVQVKGRFAKRLGDLSRNERQYAQAIRWYEEASDMIPSLGAEAAYRVASCYEEGGDLELALRWYQIINDQPPWHIKGFLAAARLLEREDRVKEAAAIYERLSREPIPEAKGIQERLEALRKTTKESI